MCENILIWGTNKKSSQTLAKEFEGFGDNICQCYGDIKNSDISVDTVDVLVMIADEKAKDDFEIGQSHDYNDILDVVMKNVLGLKKCFDTVLPFLEKGNKKRIAIVTQKSSSVSLSEKTDDFAYYMSLTAINQFIACTFNKYRKSGYTFRCFAADDGTSFSIKDYVNIDFCKPSWNVMNSDEDRIVMRNKNFIQIPW